ncbi:hypothetical protein Mycsm_02631 [Mycobacterium sp. JS623]|uniref:hypothetical protein n=1 Tax=Mycobacterium sp. JS623 TaxID=212767 RepID=UPI0002A5A6A9|nr:hypothetical protein [Mycobacterium sp. JS623]AGB22965.1 hypothetical protein Mycsm_02631 [Mycobacterium sp. JS623]
MPERVAQPIEEIARLDRDDQPGKSQIQADPAVRGLRPWPPDLAQQGEDDDQRG